MTVDVVPYSITLSEARGRVFGMINEQEGKQFTATKVDALINQACRMIYGKMNHTLFRATRDTDYGVDKYKIPDAFNTGIGAIVVGVLVDGVEVEPVAFSDANTISGTPANYALEGNILQLIPVPDDTVEITVVYEKEYFPAVLDADTFSVSDEAVDVGILFACYMMKLMDEEYTAAGMYRNAYELALDKVCALPTGVYSAALEYNTGRK
jgi:hypothetical protein